MQCLVGRVEGKCIVVRNGRRHVGSAILFFDFSSHIHVPQAVFACRILLVGSIAENVGSVGRTSTTEIGSMLRSLVDNIVRLVKALRREAPQLGIVGSVYLGKLQTCTHVGGCIGISLRRVGESQTRVTIDKQVIAVADRHDLPLLQMVARIERPRTDIIAVRAESRARIRVHDTVIAFLARLERRRWLRRHPQMERRRQI